MLDGRFFKKEKKIRKLHAHDDDGDILAVVVVATRNKKTNKKQPNLQSLSSHFVLLRGGWGSTRKETAFFSWLVGQKS